MTFAEHLARYAPAEWAAAVEALAPGIHSIDRDATRIWFAFYPQGPAPAAAASSHNFLYGHHHWPQVKRAILLESKESPWPAALADVITRIADHATRTVQADSDQLLGIATAALMTLRAVGHDVFTAASAAVQVPHWSHVKSIRQLRGSRQDRRFHFGGLRVRFSELRAEDVVKTRTGTPIGRALPAALRRCAASCTGACAVGVIDGAERLSPMAAEEQALLASSQQAVPQSSAGHPLVRLACHAMPTGDVTLVLKP